MHGLFIISSKPSAFRWHIINSECRNENATSLRDLTSEFFHCAIFCFRVLWVDLVFSLFFCFCVHYTATYVVGMHLIFLFLIAWLRIICNASLVHLEERQAREWESKRERKRESESESETARAKGKEIRIWNGCIQRLIHPNWVWIN